MGYFERKRKRERRNNDNNNNNNNNINNNKTCKERISFRKSSPFLKITKKGLASI